MHHRQRVAFAKTTDPAVTIDDAPELNVSRSTNDIVDTLNRIIECGGALRALFMPAA